MMKLVRYFFTDRLCLFDVIAISVATGAATRSGWPWGLGIVLACAISSAVIQRRLNLRRAA